ncbi:MAG: ATP-dependent DNA helicase DinG [Treponema sp.]|jgi:ATP-dependent DNA helicase DinG|nr:ATP-dependent DNA helicase DinG [Treponema sp.]
MINIDADKLCIALEENGSIARRLVNYERRDSQLDMVRFIVRAFNEEKIAAAEAGTGVGKSFAYLLPAAEFALANDERIIISTATITLQQQLFEKDIPLVLSALGKELKCSLVKGRGNYLCRRRLAEAMLEPALDNAENEELKAIIVWAEKTKTGSRSDLSFLPSSALWSRICSESDACLGYRCAEGEHCFFMALRREFAESRILIVNHHLLFADLAVRHEGAGYESTVVLPSFSRVIIDEAHNIENAATSFFSKGWNRLGINRVLSRLYRQRRTLDAGLLVRLTGQSPKTQVQKKFKAVREAAEQADAAALELCGDEGQFRLKPDSAAAYKRQGRETLKDPLNRLKKSITALVSQIRNMTETSDQEDPNVWEVKVILRRLESAAEICAAFLDYCYDINANKDNNDVFWLERQRSTQKDPWADFTISPVTIAPVLKKALFEANKTVICCSATLSTAGGSGRFEEFNFWAQRSGASLADKDFICRIFHSPFPYSKRTLLAVPTDAPLPDAADYQSFLNRAVTELVRIAGGSALVLFTSYQSLRNTYEESARILVNEGIHCYKQGDDDSNRLLQQFLTDKTSVLFGTDSFWEGVDAPGETLRLVILCRLPFKSLKDPVFEARREFLEKKGRNSFMELSLPDAVMKFKQGFGRLMRSSGDYGAIVVLDGRILQKYYGPAFLKSLPETKTSFNELNGVLLDLERFLY